MPPTVERAGADLRLLRAALFAAVCLVLSATGHAVASGGTVPAWALGTGLVAVFAVAAPLAGRERTLPGIATGLALGQLALHALFGHAQHQAAVGHPTSGGGSSDGNLVSLAARLVCNDPTGRPTAAEARRIVEGAGIHPGGPHGGHGAGHAAVTEHHSALASLLPSLPMLLAHLLAVLVLGLVLRRGEAALFRLVRLSARGVAEAGLVRALRAALALVRALITGRLPGAPPRAARTPHATDRERPDPQVPVLRHSLVRRGPPRCALAA